MTLSYHRSQSEYIHFVEGFLLAPGYVDLSNLRFFTIGEALDDDGSGEIPGEDLDDDDFTDDGSPPRKLEDSYGMDGSAVEIVVFHLVRRR